MTLDGVRKGLEKVGRYGFAARATVYVLLGVVSIQVARGVPNEASDSGALDLVARHTGGVVVLIVLFFGMAAYSIWLLSQSFFGAVLEGDKWWPRVEKAVGGLIYVSLALAALKIALGRGRSQAQQSADYSAAAMQSGIGRIAIGIIGSIIAIAGVTMLREGVTKGFAKYFAMHDIPSRLRPVVITLGAVGTITRGVVFGLVGVFVVAAAVHHNPDKARGLDYALRSLTRTALGPGLLIFVAAGLIVFGLFGFCEALWRHTKPPAESPVS